MEHRIAHSARRSAGLSVALLLSTLVAFSGTAKAAVVEVPKSAVTIALQSELRRVGCYKMRVDGVWGKGSRSALDSYLRAKHIAPQSVQPTTDLVSKLRKEARVVCKSAGSSKGMVNPQLTKASAVTGRKTDAAEKRLRLRKSLLNSGSF